MSTPSCKTCAFYDDRRCRQSPPTVVQSETGLETVWPVVGDKDWCGEWWDHRPSQSDNVAEAWNRAFQALGGKTDGGDS